MDALPELLETIEDGVAILTFNRPERMNALSTPIMEGLLKGLPRHCHRNRFGSQPRIG